MQQKQEVPTLEQLQQALTQLTLQRAAYKDQVEQIERNMSVINGQVQLLQAQAEQAKAEVSKD